MGSVGRSGGHVFVVRGKLQNIDADVLVIPTDGNFAVETTWRGLWGSDPGFRRRKPSGWGVGSCEPARTAESLAELPDIWFIDVAKHPDEEQNQVISKIVAGIAKIIEHSCTAKSSHGRQRPLVAIPTLGVSGGGPG